MQGKNPRQRESQTQFTSDEKYAAVYRLLKGDEPNRVAAELHISLDRLRNWERVFLEGGRRSLKKTRHDHHSALYIFELAGRQLLQWGGLLLLLVAIIWGASHLLQGSPE